MVEVIHGIRNVELVKLDVPVRYSGYDVKVGQLGEKYLSWVIKGRKVNSMHGGMGWGCLAGPWKDSEGINSPGGPVVV